MRRSRKERSASHLANTLERNTPSNLGSPESATRYQIREIAGRIRGTLEDNDVSSILKERRGDNKENEISGIDPTMPLLKLEKMGGEQPFRLSQPCSLFNTPGSPYSGRERNEIEEKMKSGRAYDPIELMEFLESFEQEASCLRSETNALLERVKMTKR